MRWQEGARPDLAPGLNRMARRLRLGASAEMAVDSLGPEFGADAELLGLLLAIHGDCGGDLAASLEALAASVDQRVRDRSLARASTAGAVLSSRMVVALPLLCLPLMPMSHAPVLDPLGIAMLVSGILLALTGLRWMRHLIPAPADSDEPVAAVADVLAGVVSAGVGLRQALDYVARRVPEEVREPFATASRRVALGSTWPEALRASSDPNVGALGRALLSAHRLGVPVTGSLRLFASDLRDLRTVAFEAETRKAPVMMVLPLVLCILPSFLILALGPFVRGLSIA
ncbi:MAG: tight adherence protein [Actinomycetota bacterium]|nr:tight adherence protein [Actinomycetota bacterium]